MMRNLTRSFTFAIIAFAYVTAAKGQDHFSLPDRNGFAAAPRQYQQPNLIQNRNTAQDGNTAQGRNAVQQATYQAVSDQPATNINDASGFPSLAPQARTEETVEADGSSLGPLVTTGCSLAIVLGLFAGLVWVTRRFGNGSMTQSSVPSDVMKSLGTTMIDARTRVTLLRCGERIIVMAQTQNGVHPLSEITDPAEVRRLTVACIGDAAPTFAETMRQTEPAPARGNLFTA